MNAAARSLLFVVLFSIVGLVIPAESAMAQDDLLIYDGETAATYAYGSASATGTFRGNYCFEGVPDAWHRPGIMLAGLPSYRKDISGYNELWLFAKTDQPTLGVTMEIHVWTTNGNSNYVDASPYVTGGKLDNTYRLIRIPISALKSATCPLTGINGIYFGLAKPTTAHKIYVDEIWAVTLGSVDPSQAPFIAGRESISFGDVGVRTSLTKSATLTNVGTAPLVVSAITITGAQSGDFSTPTAPFTLEAGQSQQVDAVYTPSVMGAASATLVLTHTPTVLGDTTSIALSGNGLGPLLTLSSDSMDLGSVSKGNTVSWPLTVSNLGNQDLVISNASAASPFSASPGAMTVAPDRTGELLVSFTPMAAVSATGQLTIASNDPNQPQVSVSLQANGVEATAGAAALTVRVSQVTSSTVTLAWPQFTGAATFKVYLAPEPEGTRNEPLYKMQVLELPATATGGVVEKLAAAVDAFFRVDALAGTEALATGFVHARTSGGPRAALDTPVREVHLMGPRILQIVLENKRVESYAGATGTLVGYTGAEWQAGPWTVTRGDGSAIQVTSVFRHSIPVSEDYFEIGYGKPQNDKFLDIDHNIYLVLDTNVGNRDLLHIQGPFSTDFTLPFSDKYLETPVIQLNQVGYSPYATQRWAYISGWIGDGGPLTFADFPDTAEVLVEPVDPVELRTSAVTGLAITQRAAFDDDSGGEVRQIDLSTAAPAEGVVYRVRIPGVGVSWPTQVSETAVFKAFYVIARGLYLNRWGGDLRPDCTEWSRPADHPTVYTAEKASDGFFPEATPLTGERPLTGGHHDAGDYDLRVYHDEFSMLMLSAFQSNPNALTDGQLTLPESGNGIPDVLDEALWNLKSWEQLQEDDGGVRFGVESWRHPYGFYFANEDPLPYWTYSRDVYHTARCAGLFSTAAGLVQPFDATKAAELRERAVRAYNYAVANGVGEQNGGMTIFAAGGLFRQTGEEQYRTMFEATWQALNKYGSGAFDAYRPYLYYKACYGKSCPPPISDHIMSYLGSEKARPDYLAVASTHLTSAAKDAVAQMESLHAHRNGRPSTWSPNWGQGTAVGEYMMRIYAKLQFDKASPRAVQKYFDAMSLSADYLLGGNPMGMVWVTGLGSRSPQDPLHGDSLVFAKLGKGPMPGIPVFGPCDYLSGTTGYDYGRHVCYPPFMDQPLMRRWADIRTFVTHTETASKLMARHTELLAMLVAPGMQPPASWLPGGSEHRNPLAPRESVVPSDGSEDTTPPNPGQLTAPAYSKTAPLTISYAGAYDTQSGLKDVKLWVKIGTTGAWQNTGQTSAAAAGTFQFQPTGDNRYYFFLQAEDNTGNLSPEPSDEIVFGSTTP